MKAYFKHHNKITHVINSLAGQRGGGLIEIAVVIGLLGILSVSFLGSLGQVSGSLSRTDEWQTAKTIAQDQMEYVKNQSYSSSYTAATLSSEYSDYSVYICPPATVSSRDSNIQKIKILVSHQGQPIYMGASDSTLEGYKVNR